MFAGMFFVTLGAGGSYLGFLRRDAAPAAAPGGDEKMPGGERPEPSATDVKQPQLVES
jgi:hypothetical protein